VEHEQFVAALKVRKNNEGATGKLRTSVGSTRDQTGALVSTSQSGRVPLAEAQRAIATDCRGIPTIRDERTMIRKLGPIGVCAFILLGDGFASR
jgi:hypothetical protein